MNDTKVKQKILVLRFKNQIYKNEITLFRGAVNLILSQENNNILFHNHDGDNLRYSYPLIQYKRINSNASMVCINEGTEAIGLLLSKGSFECKLGERVAEFEVDTVNANQFLIQTWQSSFTYILRKWLPLNQDNYQEYQKLERMADKCIFLEKILIGNILSMGKGLGIHFENEISCEITDILDSNIMRYKNVKMTTLDIEFKSNVSLPDYIGLGKGSSTGFGMVTRKLNSK